MLPAGDATEGVEFIHEADGSVTARDIETGVSSFGETKAEALAMLAEALGLYRGEIGHEPTDDELRELGVDPETARTQGELPDVLQGSSDGLGDALADLALDGDVDSVEAVRDCREDR